MQINFNQLLNPHHTDLFQSTNDVLLVRGSANAGKTYSIMDKLLLCARGLYLSPKGPIFDDIPKRCLVIRRTLPSIKKSILPIMETRAKLHGFQWELNKTDCVAQIGSMRFDFCALNEQKDYEKLQSITDVDFIWANEIVQIRESDFDILQKVLRGGKYFYSQIIGDFNPISRKNWINKRFYLRESNARKLKYTFEDNPWCTQAEKDRLLNHPNPNFVKIYAYGEWGEYEGRIYDWDIVDKLPEGNLDVWYGLDFGFTVNPAALIRIHRKGNEFWVEEVIYRTGLTNPHLAKEMKNKKINPHSPIYADSAEPKSIKEIKDHGFNIWSCDKGSDTVKAQIDFLKSIKIHILSNSPNIIDECEAYRWDKDSSGKNLEAPIKDDDHAMDAIRYAIYTHLKRPSYMGAIWGVETNARMQNG